MSYLRSGPISLPNSTMMGHSRALELDEVSSVPPVGVAHRRRGKIVGLMTLGAAGSVLFTDLPPVGIDPCDVNRAGVESAQMNPSYLKN